MEEIKNLNNFHIQCKNCEAASRKYHTLLYVDWNKKRYILSCYKCDMTEAFDENGNLIKIPETKEEPKKDDNSIN